MRGAEALARLYSAARLFVNVFQPSFKLACQRSLRSEGYDQLVIPLTFRRATTLAEKTRVGARVHKRYHAPATPCARLLS